MEGLPSLDATPSGVQPSRRQERQNEEIDALKLKLKTMKKSDKLKMLDDNLLDAYIIAMVSNSLRPMELGAVVTYLKNNKEVAEKKEHSEADLIDELVEDE